MKTLDRKLLERFLRLAGDDLEGDFILIGGTVLIALGVEHRTTTDIDLIGKTKKEQAQTLRLMELSEKLGLAVESINQAGALFLTRIPKYEERLVLMHEGKTARIFRPDATLYLLLKLRRLSESDLSDCLQWLKWCEKQDEHPDKKAVKSAIQSEIKKSESLEKAKRLKELLKHLA